MRLGRLLRWSTAGFTLLAAAFAAPPAQAETDTFGIGDGHTGPKTVAGTEVVNAYASLTADVAAGGSTLPISTVIGSGAFGAGDLVLVWRATGVAASEAPSGDPKKQALPTALATTSAANEAGLVGTFEFARVQAVAAGSITLTKPLARGFTKFVSQVVRVPEYTTVSVPAATNLVAAPWQEIGGTPSDPNPNAPWAGGILIFMATGAVTNNGTIHANGRGFHGGLPEARLINPIGVLCNNNALDGNPVTQPFSPKGQGVVQTQYLRTLGGKGNISMAGGGGNCLEGGGGGGANSGNGGNGSGSLLGLGAGGNGGAGITYDMLSRLTMGGGGGSGRHIVAALGSRVSFGGFGGGVVYVRGASMAGNGRIQANGDNGENSGLIGLPVGVASEGSGGGGAGGTISIRLTGTLACDSLGSPGGNGGSAQVAGIPVFGAGGGGGGGRVLYQATSKTADCDIILTPGNPGNGGQGGSQPGTPGGTQPPTGGYCFDVQPPGNAGACADPTPICDTNGSCSKCSGPFGGGAPQACNVAVEPVCMTTGACVPCNGDFASNSTQACQLAGAPYCFLTGGAGVAGSCGKCTSNADCATGHNGPICNVLSGSCGTACQTDADCKTTEWCAPRDTAGNNVCTPKTPNGQPLPPFPPIDGECTREKGQRVCLSAVCEESDDLCGKKNGAPCTGASECRSDICFGEDDLCGLPNGQPCTGSGQCRSDVCENGVCTGGCDDDKDCKLGQVCDSATKDCVPGCRPGVSTVDGGQVHGGCPPGLVCVSPDGGAIGQCVPGSDGGYGGDGGPIVPVDTSGIIEGGGCSCNSTLSSAASPFAILGAICTGLLIGRRRKGSKKR